MDIELMRRLSPRVNVIPVIGKADTFTPTELRDFKKRVRLPLQLDWQQIMEDIDHYEIPVYNFPYDIEEDDEETIAENSELRALLPFAIVGSEEEIMVGGTPVRGRRYPWGIVEVDNPQHSDFSRLRGALLMYVPTVAQRWRWQTGLTWRTSKRSLMISCTKTTERKSSLDLSVVAIRKSHTSGPGWQTVTRQSSPKTWPTSRSDSRKNNFDERKRSFERLNSRSNERFKSRGKNCSPKRTVSKFSRLDLVGFIPLEDLGWPVASQNGM
jgi:septin family protein